MNSEHSSLRNFLRGYLHQDWKQEHGSIDRVVRQFCGDAGPGEVRRVGTEWHEFMEWTKGLPLGEITRQLTQLGSAWQPASVAELEALTRALERCPPD
ncbi:MAG: hypothetical protein JO266_16315 [Acidobacteria bacterium]|nr:hypothetical protein [Acidobacteriota bacterium]MBV8893508.1 hypothetical protein [Acidobacteriota bacterium]MBV9479141.1 hypothetical protein [Acidobacteriota bacterium]